jgi:hypothetical protein
MATNVFEVLTEWIESQPAGATLVAVPVHLASYDEGRIVLSPIKPGESYDTCSVSFLLTRWPQKLSQQARQSLPDPPEDPDGLLKY